MTLCSANNQSRRLTAGVLFYMGFVDELEMYYAVGWVNKLHGFMYWMDFSIQIARKHTFPSAFRTSRYRLAGPRGQVLHATHRPAAGHSQKQNEIFPEFHSPRRILSFPAGIQSFSQVSIICQYSVPLTIFTCSFLLMIFLFCYFFAEISRVGIGAVFSEVEM